MLYAATVATVTIFSGLIRLYVPRAQLLSDAGTREFARREHWSITPAVFLVSIPIAFASPSLAKLSWLLLLLPGLRRRRRTSPRV